VVAVSCKTWIAARLGGFGVRESAAIGALMNTRGLTELIVLNIGLDLGLITPELFTILAPNPQFLDRLVKSAKSVTIEAVSVMGDNVNIQKIDGKAYQEAKAGKPKGK